VDPVAFPRRRGGVDDLLHVPGLYVLAGDHTDDRGGEPLAQPALGVGVLAGPPLIDREPGRRSRCADADIATAGRVRIFMQADLPIVALVPRYARPVDERVAAIPA
jgi:hypothetical protein